MSTAVAELGFRPELARTKEEFYNPVASIDMMRGDLRRTGAILPETLKRVDDEDLSMIAEGIDRPMRTDFRLEIHDGILSYFDKGEWRPYVAAFVNGLRAAEAKAEKDPRAGFLARRAYYEWQEGYKLEGLEPGQSLVVCSPFAHEAYLHHGRRFVMEQGFWPGRDLGFIRVSTKQKDGSVVITSLTVDRSDMDSFSGVLDAAGAKVPEGTTADDMVDIQPVVNSVEDLPEQLRNIYDQILSAKLGIETYAGRTSLDKQNSWQLLHQQTDLLAYYKDESIKLALSELNGKELEIAKKKLTYGIWAAVKRRIDNNIAPQALWSDARDVRYVEDITALYNLLAEEVSESFRSAQQLGEVLLACGGSIGNILEAAVADVHKMIFGKKDDKNEKKEIMKCVTCPFCKKTVDAIKTKSKICCPNCKAESKLN
ncbi:hypothetical protein HY003_01090 [Candidatus Saccharibacteria bacterium]|nr:hypothetical protein [Candidatus Saccharibacteria bacterium]MBI3337872.1 hypothetical protein [Candidatus Saccharibacteria bacterium]